MNGKVKQYTGNGFEVPAMILLQAYLCTYSLLRGVTFEVLPLSNYSFSPMMLPLLEIFLELLLWHSFQCARHILLEYLQSPGIFSPFKADFIFENNQKSFGAKLGE